VPTTKPCGVPLELDVDGQPELDGPRCALSRKPTKVKCPFHWLLSQPIEVQVRAGQRRREDTKMLQPRSRVPSAQWPEGTRWCAGCQSFVPTFYVQGSRCRACNSEANHASHIQRTYALSSQEYEALLAWQGGVCFICGQTPRSRRLAVDHDHATGAVRGLLCANDEWGCNVLLRRLLGDLDMARRAVEYVQTPPLTRMRLGEPARAWPRKAGIMELTRGARPAPALVPLGDWQPW